MRSLSDPFDDARIRLDAARESIGKFNSIPGGSFKIVPCDSIGEDGTAKVRYVYRLRLEDQRRTLKGIASQAIGSLRSALDLAIAACARLHGTDRNTDIYFPFAKNAARFEKGLAKLGKFVPNEVITYLRTLRPYGGGDDRLHAFVEMRNSGEHWEIIPVRVGVLAAGVRRPHDPSQTIVEVPSPGSGAVEDIELFTSDTKESDCRLELLVQTRFQDVPAFAGNEAGAVLMELEKRVAEIIDALERIARRLDPC
jgi:hypothetical protein